MVEQAHIVPFTVFDLYAPAFDLYYQNTEIRMKKYQVGFHDPFTAPVKVPPLKTVEYSPGVIEFLKGFEDSFFSVVARSLLVLRLIKVYRRIECYLPVLFSCLNLSRILTIASVSSLQYSRSALRILLISSGS